MISKYLSALDRKGRTIWIADAHRDGKRFIVQADEKLTASLELETAIRPTSAELELVTKPALATQFAPQGNQAERSESEQGKCRACIGNARWGHADVVEEKVTTSTKTER